MATTLVIADIEEDKDVVITKEETLLLIEAVYEQDNENIKLLDNTLKERDITSDGFGGTSGTSGTSGTGDKGNKEGEQKVNNNKSEPTPDKKPAKNKSDKSAQPAPSKVVSSNTGAVATSSNGGQPPPDVKPAQPGDFQKLKDNFWIVFMKTPHIGYDTITDVKKIGKRSKKGDDPAPMYEFQAHYTQTPPENYGFGSSFGADYFKNNYQPLLAKEWKSKGYKNFINLSLFETAGTGWGAGQPTGLFIADKKYYGAKPRTQTWETAPVIAEYDDGTVDIVELGTIFDKNTLNVKGNKPKTAARMLTYIVKNGKVQNAESAKSNWWPVFGKCFFKGEFKYFAGVGNGSGQYLGNFLVEWFKKQGDIKKNFVSDVVIGDGGGSAQLYVDGNPIRNGAKRPIPIIAYW